MPFIQATIIKGRSDKQKQAFFEKVTAAAAETLSVKPKQVRITLNEVLPEHWAVGGVSKADLDTKKVQ
ncbi:MAG: 4-oxalocrotonate tautomerase [Gammaproteobacteria bacterium]|nr:MAG: 4-oxalocrotonate tautomerase [Gammaproteobacteria bacterium]